MQLELKCKKCDEAFSADFAELTADPELRCPGCDARATEEQVEALTGAMEDLFAAVASLRRKFTITGDLDGDDLPPPYDEAPAAKRGKAALLEDEDDEEDEDEDEE
ncbi:MAG: hypothetical protein JST92_14370 [Deltaproteobacteria bacterium]|nr:hypothetical protein [Deltaproteobacteria bacterium]